MEAMKQAPAAATAEAAKPATPTVDEIVESYLEAQEHEHKLKVDVFADCVKDGAVTVPSADHASEIARMMLRAEDDLERAKAIAEAMVRRAASRVASLEFLFHTPLQIWTTANLVGKKGKSILLDGGKLSLRAIPEQTRYVDQDVTLAWAQENHKAAVEMVPKLKTDAVLAWEAENKTAAPGRELTPAHDSFSVSVPKSK